MITGSDKTDEKHLNNVGNFRVLHSAIIYGPNGLEKVILSILYHL